MYFQRTVFLQQIAPYIFKKFKKSSKEKNSKNFYFDIRLQTAKDKIKCMRVMVERGKSSKRKFFSG